MIVCDDVNLNAVLDIVKSAKLEVKSIITIGSDRKDAGCVPIR